MCISVGADDCVVVVARDIAGGVRAPMGAAALMSVAAFTATTTHCVCAAD